MPDVPLRVAGLALGQRTVAVFDLGAVLPPELPKLDGLLALPSFVDHVVTFDLARDRLIFESEAGAAARRAEQWPLQFRVASGGDGSSLTVLVAAEAEPEAVWLLLDSGNLVGTLLSPSGARQLGRGGTESQSGASIELDLQLIGMPSHSTRALIRDIMYDGVLGVSFFLAHVVTMDLRGQQPWGGARFRGQQ